MEKRINVEGDLNDLKPGEGVAGYEYASKLEAISDPIADPGIGKTVSIRVFEFKMNPDPKVIKHFPTDSQVIFNSHAKQIQTILWGDGLIHLAEVAPRVIIDKKGHKYQIFVPCEARPSTFFADKPKSLNEHLTNGTRRNKK